MPANGACGPDCRQPAAPEVGGWVLTECLVSGVHWDFPIVSRSKTCLCGAVHAAWRVKRFQAVGQISVTMAKFDADLPPSDRELIVKNHQRLDV